MDKTGDKENPVCPACLSNDIKVIGDNEPDMHGIGLYGIYNLPVKLYQVQVQYECRQCHYRF